VKEFVVYTGLRLLLFLGTFGVVVGIWSVATDEFNLAIALAVAFVVSGVGSYFLLDKQRAAFAQRVEARAERASAAFEQMKAKEDADEGAS
jgi:hypothetical protein